MASYVYQHHSNGTTYVYQNESWWDKETKTVKHRRTYIGKQVPGSDEIIPPRKKKGRPEPGKSREEEGHCTVRTLGPALLLDQAASETGLRPVLEEVFPRDFQKILTCAYFLACEEKPLCFVEQWSQRSVHPSGGKLDEEQVSELLARITPSEQRQFFKKWIEENRTAGYLAMDITSAASFKDCADYGRDGADRDEEDRDKQDRDEEDLPFLRLFLLARADNRVPVYCKILDGAVTDMPALQACLKGLSFLNRENTHFLLDEDFFRAENVSALFEQNVRFTMRVPSAARFAEDAAERTRAESQSFQNHLSAGPEDLSAVTETGSWDGRPYYVHTFFDEKRAVCKEFFTGTDGPKDERDVTPDEEAMEAQRKGLCGFSVLISSDEKHAADAFRAFREKEAAARKFDDLKNDLDKKRLRIHTDERMQGRIFLQFLSLILEGCLRSVMDEKGLSERYDPGDIFEEMKSLQAVSLEGRKKRYHTSLSEEQKKLAQAFGLRI